MDKDFKAENVELCQSNASIVNAKYFVYDFDEQNCVLHSSTEKQCDLIFGPPTPAYESCDGDNYLLLIVIVACIGCFLILLYVMLMILFSKIELALCVCKMKCCSRSEDTQIIIEHEHNIHPNAQLWPYY